MRNIDADKAEDFPNNLTRARAASRGNFRKGLRMRGGTEEFPYNLHARERHGLKKDFFIPGHVQKGMPPPLDCEARRKVALSQNWHCKSRLRATKSSCSLSRVAG